MTLEDRVKALELQLATLVNMLQAERNLQIDYTTVLTPTRKNKA